MNKKVKKIFAAGRNVRGPAEESETSGFAFFFFIVFHFIFLSSLHSDIF